MQSIDSIEKKDLIGKTGEFNKCNKCNNVIKQHKNYL